LFLQVGKNFALCQSMQNALSLLANKINRDGGIRISKTETRRLEVISVDDGGQVLNVTSVTKAMLDGRVTGRPVDFVIGPYTTALSEPASNVANASGALFMSAGAAAASVFIDRKLSFGLLSPSTTYLQSGVALLHAKGIRSIALLMEKDDSASLEYCAGANATAMQLGIRVVASVGISVEMNRTQVAGALDQFRSSKPDAVVGCTKYDNCAELLKQAAADPGFYVQAMIFTLCVTEPRFADLPKSQTAYVLGVTPWFDKDTQTDDLLGWSPAYFAEKYQGVFGKLPPYQAVAAFAAGLLLAKAIEAAGSLEPNNVAAQLVGVRTRTVYGNVSFNANRQNVAPFLTIQASPNKTKQQVVVTADTAVIPMPSWRQRQCEVADRCADMGVCKDDGNCTYATCLMGYFTVGQSRRCEACPAGSFSSSGTVEACTPCAAGTRPPPH
jgi:ABC-type branched-subunit amino acid transport system substrate-binding protein